MRLKLTVLLCFVVPVFPLEVSAQQVVDQDEVRNLLIKACEVNRSLLRYGRIQAAVELSWYDEKRSSV